MTDYYTGCPVTGVVTALGFYCDGSGNHRSAQLSNPRDVDDQPEGQAVTYFGPYQSLSRRTTRLCCKCGCSSASPYADAVLVEFFTGYWAGGTKIGEMFYLHLSNRIADGVYNTNQLDVGWVPGGTNCCYFGTHSHFESNGAPQSLSCWQPIGAGAAVYKWTL